MTKKVIALVRPFRKKDKKVEKLIVQIPTIMNKAPRSPASGISALLRQAAGYQSEIAP